ncbi:MAG: hypothetical protein OEY94_10595 [Alphaproteobacteria bacterium]|nr:hypothetical protein [Alphaproteobacteria bacterium]
MSNSAPSLSLHFSPVLSVEWFIPALAVALILLIFCLWPQKQFHLLRLLGIALLFLILINPSVLEEKRRSINDVAVIVVDKSASQKYGKRTEMTNQALEHLKAEAQKYPELELRIIEAPDGKEEARESLLFRTLDTALSDTPKSLRAGVIFLSDGQIHDVPDNPETMKDYGPVHTLLTGSKNEKDRRIEVINAPAYGVTGQEVTVKYKILDTENIKSNNVSVTLTQHDGQTKTFFVPVGKEQSLSIPIDHAGQNIFTLEVESVENELTLANNKAPLIINGVRDRLKVLLVSGKPHTGTRTWRDLLKSDPGVDLVHFTILREPQKMDFTPQNELSLIAFPIRELFEIKLYDFDLIIFDQYKVNNILPARYFRNIANYVKEGGAFLEVSGDVYADRHSIYHTALKDILPSEPTGEIYDKAFRPDLTDLGYRHPVTRNLVWNNVIAKEDKKPVWGEWIKQIDINVRRGDILMKGVKGKPLLILDRIAKGRVAHISSEHIWLWARGYDGGGPHAELMRRIVHWLMKEPELDEHAMSVSVHKDVITIEKNIFEKDEETIAMTTPNAEFKTITLKKENESSLVMRAKIKAQDMGVYAFEDTHGSRKFALLGDLTAPEFTGIISTEKNMKTIAQETGGKIIWLEDTPKPSLKRTRSQTTMHGGNGWLGLRSNNHQAVTSTKDTPLFPAWFQLLALIVFLPFIWWREGKE